MYSLYLRYIISYIVNNNAKSAIFSPKVSMITNVILILCNSSINNKLILRDLPQQAPDVYVTSGWRWTWRQTDVAFWLKMKIGLTSIWRWLNVGFWLHNLKTTKSQCQLTSVLDINLTLILDVGFTLNFGHPTSQPQFNQISTSYDVVCLFCACWDVLDTIFPAFALFLQQK